MQIPAGKIWEMRGPSIAIARPAESDAKSPAPSRENGDLHDFVLSYYKMTPFFLRDLIDTGAMRYDPGRCAKNYNAKANPDLPCLAMYIAASALLISACAVVPFLGNIAMPMLALTSKLMLRSVV